MAFPVRARPQPTKGTLGPVGGGGRTAFLQTQQSVDLGMLDRDPNTPPPVDITVTPASSLPCNLTYSQGNELVCFIISKNVEFNFITH